MRSPSPTPLALLVVAIAACGAEDVDAPETPNLDVCPSVDEYLVDVYAVMDAGDLDHVEEVISGDLDDDARADLVVTVVELVDAMAPGTFVALGDLASAADDAPGLEDTLAAAVAVLATDGPDAPYPDALGAVRVVLHTCEGPPVLQLLLDLLTDPELRGMLTDAPGAFQGTLGSGDLPSIDLDLADLDTREAIRALLINVLSALASDAVDLDPLLDLLGLFLDVDSPPWDAVVGLLEALLEPGPRADAVQGLVACLLAADPALTLVDAVLDIVVVADLGGGLSLPDGDAEPALPPALEAAAVALLETLHESSEARRVLVDLLSALLADHAAPGVLANMVALLEAHVVGDIVATLGALATRSCSP